MTMDGRLAALIAATRVTSGVVVASTVPGAIDAPDGGLAPGDVIYAVNGRPITALNELRTLVDGLRDGDAGVLQIERRGELMFVAFRVD